MTTLPTLHLNGTPAARLCADWTTAANVCDDAISAIGLVEFHARDYYPQGPEAFEKARAELQKHVEAIRAARDAFMAVAEHVSQFVK